MSVIMPVLGTLMGAGAATLAVAPFAVKKYVSNPDLSRPAIFTEGAPYVARIIPPETCSVVKRGGRVIDLLIDPNWTIEGGVDKLTERGPWVPVPVSEENPALPYRSLWDWYLSRFGIRWVGVYFDRLHRYPFPHIVRVERNGGFEYEWHHNHSEYAFLGRQTFHVVIESLETGEGENVKVHAVATVEVQVSDLYIVFFEHANWFELMLAALEGEARKYVHSRTFDDLLDDGKNGPHKSAMGDILSNVDISRLGVKILRAVVSSFEMADPRADEARNAVFIEKKKAEAVEHTARATERLGKARGAAVRAVAAAAIENGADANVALVTSGFKDLPQNSTPVINMSVGGGKKEDGDPVQQAQLAALYRIAEKEHDDTARVRREKK